MLNLYLQVWIDHSRLPSNVEQDNFEKNWLQKLPLWMHQGELFACGNLVNEASQLNVSLQNLQLCEKKAIGNGDADLYPLVKSL